MTFLSIIFLLKITVKQPLFEFRDISQNSTNFFVQLYKSIFCTTLQKHSLTYIANYFIIKEKLKKGEHENGTQT